jgi:hypothetical protein
VGELVPHIQLDLDFLTHPKTLAISPLAQLLFIRSLIYAATHLTDGFIPAPAMAPLTYDLTQYERCHFVPENVHAAIPDVVTVEELIAELLAHKRWKICRDGYRIHDYLDYQLSRREVMQLIDKKRKAGQAGGQASAQARAQRLLGEVLPTNLNGFQPPSPSPSPSPDQKREKKERLYIHKRAISDEDKPTDKHFAFGKSLGVDVGPEWGKFKNYCLAHDKRYANFDAAFRNWLANAAQYTKEARHVLR